MPNYEIALPAGSKNIKVKASTMEVPVDWYFTRDGRDGAEVIVPLFGGDEFVGEVLEGNWLKGDDGDIEGPFTVKLNGSGSLELIGRSDVAGTGRRGWITSKSKIVLLDDTIIDIHLKMPSLTASNSIALNFSLVSTLENPEVADNVLQIYLKADTTKYYIRIRKKINGVWSNVIGETPVTSQEGTFRIKFQENKPGHNHSHVYYHDGAGLVDESADEITGSPFALNLAFESAYVNYLFYSDETTNRTVSSDFVRVTYPDFKVVYDLDDDAYQGEGEELLKKAWDTSGNGNHGTVYGATWVRDGKFGKALSFDGDDYVEVPHDASLTPTDLTIVIKVRWTGGSTGLLRKGTVNSVYYSNYEIRYSDEACDVYFGIGGTTYWKRDIGTPKPFEWTQLAVTFEDATEVRTYQDGVQTGVWSIDFSYYKDDSHLIIGAIDFGGLKLFMEGEVAYIRIYNRALEPEEIQTLYNGGEVTDGLVGEWKFEGGNDRGEVKVYDTMGSDDEFDWQRVFDVNHQFVGDCVIENGLIRLWIDESTLYGLKLYYWDGSAWTQLADRILWSGVSQYPFLYSIDNLSPEKVVLKVSFENSAVQDRDKYIDVTISLERSKYFFTIEFEDIRGYGTNAQPQLVKTTPLRFGYVGDSMVGDDDISVYSNNTTISDNFGLAFDPSYPAIIGVILNEKPPSGNQAFRASGGDLYFRTWTEKEILNLKETIFLIPFSQVVYLFKEAEDATLGGGATVDTTQTDDSGDSVLLDAQYEKVTYYFTGITDLPKGRYLAVFRAKDTNQVANDVLARVHNTTEDRYLNEENSNVYLTLTSSFAYYFLVFDITDDDDGDSLEIKVQKDTASANSIYVDYFLIIPISNGESWPQDLAHNALRTLTEAIKAYKR